jgi:hypothetical protein
LETANALTRRTPSTGKSAWKVAVRARGSSVSSAVEAQPLEVDSRHGIAQLEARLRQIPLAREADRG